MICTTREALTSSASQVKYKIMMFPVSWTISVKGPKSKSMARKNLIDKDGVRKTYGLAKDDNYVGAVMSGLGDVLNAGMVTIPIARLKAARDINPTYYSHKDEI